MKKFFESVASAAILVFYFIFKRKQDEDRVDRDRR